MSSKQFSYIWEYTVDPARQAEFLSAYKPDGTWAQLMSRHPGYLGTKLLQDVETDNRFVTVDAWMNEHSGELGAIAQHWFDVIRERGDGIH